MCSSWRSAGRGRRRAAAGSPRRMRVARRGRARSTGRSERVECLAGRTQDTAATPRCGAGAAATHRKRAAPAPAGTATRGCRASASSIQLLGLVAGGHHRARVARPGGRAGERSSRPSVRSARRCRQRRRAARCGRPRRPAPVARSSAGPPERPDRRGGAFGAGGRRRGEPAFAERGQASACCTVARTGRAPRPTGQLGLGGEQIGVHMIAAQRSDLGLGRADEAEHERLVGLLGQAAGLFGRGDRDTKVGPARRAPRLGSAGPGQQREPALVRGRTATRR